MAQGAILCPDLDYRTNEVDFVVFGRVWHSFGVRASFLICKLESLARNFLRLRPDILIIRLFLVTLESSLVHSLVPDKMVFSSELAAAEKVSLVLFPVF